MGSPEEQQRGRDLPGLGFTKALGLETASEVEVGMGKVKSPVFNPVHPGLMIFCMLFTGKYGGIGPKEADLTVLSSDLSLTSGACLYPRCSAKNMPAPVSRCLFHWGFIFLENTLTDLCIK